MCCWRNVKLSSSTYEFGKIFNIFIGVVMPKLSPSHLFKNYLDYSPKLLITSVNLVIAFVICRLKNPPAVAGEILYGLHSAVLALAAGRRPFHKCYIQDTLLHSERPLMQQLQSLLKEKAVDIEACSKSVLSYLSQARPHQVSTI